MARETIYETFMLPSMGKIYSKQINPVVDLTCLKVWQEMKKLSPTDMPYKMMSGIIEECLKEKLAIPVYDLCLGDYQYLLYKLRIVTYGSEYKMSMICPKCGSINETIVNLDDLEVIECPDNYATYTHITLPESDDIIDLNYQTPRMLDEINLKSKKMQTKLKTNTDYSLMFTLMSSIDKINGEDLNEVQLEDYCKNLSMKDANFLLRSIDKLNSQIGMSINIIANCPNPKCGEDVLVPFRITNEFFEPTL